MTDSANTHARASTWDPDLFGELVSAHRHLQRLASFERDPLAKAQIKVTVNALWGRIRALEAMERGPWVFDLNTAPGVALIGPIGAVRQYAWSGQDAWATVHEMLLNDQKGWVPLSSLRASMSCLHSPQTIRARRDRFVKWASGHDLSVLASAAAAIQIADGQNPRFRNPEPRRVFLPDIRLIEKDFHEIADQNPTTTGFDRNPAPRLATG